MNTMEVYKAARNAYLTARQEMVSMDRQFGGTDCEEDRTVLITHRAAVAEYRKAYEAAGRELDRVTFGG